MKNYIIKRKNESSTKKPEWPTKWQHSKWDLQAKTFPHVLEKVSMTIRQQLEPKRPTDGNINWNYFGHNLVISNLENAEILWASDPTPTLKNVYPRSCVQDVHCRGTWVAQSVKVRLWLRSWAHSLWVPGLRRALCWQLSFPLYCTGFFLKLW